MMHFARGGASLNSAGRRDCGRSMSDGESPGWVQPSAGRLGMPRGVEASSTAADAGFWRRRYEAGETERGGLAQQGGVVHEIGAQLSEYAGDLNRTYLELRRHLSQLTALHEISLHIGTLLDAEAVVQATVDALQRLVAADSVYLFLQERGAYEIRLRAARAESG